MALFSRVGLRCSPSRVLHRLFSSNSLADGGVSEEASGIELWTWGKNEVGQLGLGDEETRRSPALAISMALPHSAIPATTPGRLAAPTSVPHVEEAKNLQFSSGNSQLSEASTRSIHTSRSVLHEKVGISSGLFHSCLWTGGKVWVWGKGGGGRLGRGSEQSQFSPSQLSSIPDVKSLALGGLHSVAVTQGGSVYTWFSGASEGSVL